MKIARAKSRILVWDLPTRIFHWLLAASFAGAWLTADSERWIDVHVLFGYTMAVLVGFRVVWGLVGTRHARFSSFAYGPRDVLAYVKSLVRFRAPHYTGHNPAGSWAIYAMLALAVVVTATGIATFNDAGGHWLEEWHEVAAGAMLTLVFVHIAGVLAGSALHRENLVASMLTGYKSGGQEDAIGTPRRIVAVVLLAALTGVWMGVLPLPGIVPDPALTSVKADARVARHTGEDD